MEVRMRVVMVGGARGAGGGRELILGRGAGGWRGWRWRLIATGCWRQDGADGRGCWQRRGDDGRVVSGCLGLTVMFGGVVWGVLLMTHGW